MVQLSLVIPQSHVCKMEGKKWIMGCQVCYNAREDLMCASWVTGKDCPSLFISTCLPLDPLMASNSVPITLYASDFCGTTEIHIRWPQCVIAILAATLNAFRCSHTCSGLFIYKYVQQMIGIEKDLLPLCHSDGFQWATVESNGGLELHPKIGSMRRQMWKTSWWSF